MLPDIYGLEREHTYQSRPIGLTILATISGLSGFLLAVGAIAQLYRWVTALLALIQAGDGVAVVVQAVIGVFSLGWLLVGLAMMALDIGLLQLRKWAWIGCLILQALVGGIAVLGLCLALVRGEGAGILNMAIGLCLVLVTVGYLLRRPIKTACCR